MAGGSTNFEVLAEDIRREIMVAMLESLQVIGSTCADICIQHLRKELPSRPAHSASFFELNADDAETECASESITEDAGSILMEAWPADEAAQWWGAAPEMLNVEPSAVVPLGQQLDSRPESLLEFGLESMGEPVPEALRPAPSVAPQAAPELAAGVQAAQVP